MIYPQELPPRARRIPVPARKKIAQERTTSACAENTPLEGAPYVWGGNYLRVRGEYVNTLAAPRAYTELPPRARRIRGHWAVSSRKNGTTSACAENTICPIGLTHGPWNYLRVRGEYSWGSAGVITKAELPPRARRIPPCRDSDTRSRGNYLRVRGEYTPGASKCPPRRELPPRARRIQVAAGGPTSHLGTTSACAENTRQKGHHHV